MLLPVARAGSSPQSIRTPAGTAITAIIAMALPLKTGGPLSWFRRFCCLITALCEFDDFIEGVHGRPPRPVMHAVLPTVSEPLPAQSPVEVVEEYWRTRDLGLLHLHPHSASSMDTQLAEQVFRTATAL